MIPDIHQLQQRLMYQFAESELLSQALTHRSFGQPNNERLEFLGDSILNCVIAIALFEKFPQLREGTLSRLRASLVRQEGLHTVASQLALGEWLRLGEGELRSGGHSRPSILADALEAVFAAIYLDGGFSAAKAVIERLYAPLLKDIDPERSLKDPKTALQEWLQARKKSPPEYRLIEVRGEAHAQEFEIECAILTYNLCTRGCGASRRVAEQQAAAQALSRLAE